MTKIEWCDETWNPVSGCAKVSAGCEHCYAETYAHRFWGDRKFTDVQCHEDRLDQPLRWKKPRKVFVNSMSDLFHPDVPEFFIDKVFSVMAMSPQHTFQILTKRPEQMREYIFWTDNESLVKAGSKVVGRADAIMKLDRCPWPIPNVWLGVSVEDQKTADERIPILLETPAAIRFVSYEPALSKVDFSECLKKNLETSSRGLNWIIVGGESGTNARPMHPDWARSVRDQCQDAGVPFFFKQWGEWGPTSQIADNVPITKCMTTDGVFAEFFREKMIQADPNCTNWEGLRKLGKKRAGRLLDGVEHDEFPLESS